MIRSLVVLALLSASAFAESRWGVDNSGGEYVVSPSGDVFARVTVRGLELFDVATAKLIATRTDLPGTVDGFRGIALSVDGKRAAVRHEKTREVLVLDVASGKTLSTVRADGELQFLSDGRLAVLGEHDVQVIDDSGVHALLAVKGTPIHLTPDGAALVVRDASARLAVVDAKSGAVITRPPVDVAMIERAKSGRWVGLTIHGEHSAIVTWATGDKKARTLYASHASRHEEDGQDDAGLKTFVLPAPYDVIYTAARSDEHDTIRLRGVDLDGKLVFTSKWIGFDAELEGVARAGDALVVTSDNCLSRLDRDGAPVTGPQLCSAGYQLAFAADGTLVTMTAGGVRTYDATGAMIRTQSVPREIDARDPATLVRLATDPRTLATMERARKLVDTGAVQISDDGHWMFVEGAGSSSIIDLRTWTARTKLQDLVASRDGSRYAIKRATPDVALEVRSTQDDALIRSIPVDMDSRTRFSDDGTKLVIAVLGRLELDAMIVDIATGTTLFTARCLHYALSRDGQRIACSDKNVVVYDIATHATVATMAIDRVNDMVFSNDDRQLVIGKPTQIIVEPLR